MERNRLPIIVLLVLTLALGAGAIYLGFELSKESQAPEETSADVACDWLYCTTWDCPNGDTNSDGQCTAADNGSSIIGPIAKGTGICANPASTCGQVDYYDCDPTAEPTTENPDPWGDCYCGHEIFDMSACLDNPEPDDLVCFDTCQDTNTCPVIDGVQTECLATSTGTKRCVNPDCVDDNNCKCAAPVECGNGIIDQDDEQCELGVPCAGEYAGQTCNETTCLCTPIEEPECGDDCVDDSDCPTDNVCSDEGACIIEECEDPNANCSADLCSLLPTPPELPETAIIDDQTDAIIVAFLAIIGGILLIKLDVASFIFNVFRYIKTGNRDYLTIAPKAKNFEDSRTSIKKSFEKKIINSK